MIRLTTILSLTIALQISAACAIGYDHDHNHGNQESQEKKAPRIFFDKPARIVNFQLRRLDNAALLRVERRDDDPKYLPAHLMILTRNGMANQDREIALNAIAKINQTDPAEELLKIIPTIGDSKDQNAVPQQLNQLLLGQNPDQLKRHIDQLVKTATSDDIRVRATGYAALITAGESEKAIELSSVDSPAKAAMLSAIGLLGNQQLRNSMRPRVIESLAETEPETVRLAAVTTLATINSDRAGDFKVASKLVSNSKLRRAAVKTLLGVPRKLRNSETATELADFLVAHAEKTPAADRTSNEFIESMQLADQILGLVEKDKSDAYRKRLDAVTVRVILIHTVDEEMRYDIPWFAVEAGTEVQLILKNEDLMAHNLVVTMPDALQEVALQAAADGPAIGKSGKQYVPDSDKVLFATDMVPSEKQARVTFTAPANPGEYPYVCTFPGHWMRMYGVMVVTKDLAEFQRNPIEPKDPVGQNRPIVKTWTIDDFKDKTESGLRGRTEKIGKRLFAEATCAQCHKIGDEGQAVGPELTDIWTRWKGDSTGILREIIEPSHKIAPEYMVRKVITLDGDIVSGIVVAEDKESISILPNPESKKPTVIAKEEVDEMMQSSVSIMPKGLLDRFTEDEIFEILAYLKTVDPKK
ncbi:MAG: c-type cytochrome [Mariniblastus sp.]